MSTSPTSFLFSPKWSSPRQARFEARGEKVSEDGVEYHALVVVGHVHVPDHVEVPNEPRGNVRSRIEREQGRGLMPKLSELVQVHPQANGAGAALQNHPARILRTVHFVVVLMDFEAGWPHIVGRVICCGRPCFEPALSFYPRRLSTLPAATRRTHGAHHGDIDDLPVGQLLAVIPAFLVEPLAEDFYRRLSAVFLSVGHGCQVWW